MQIVKCVNVLPHLFLTVFVGATAAVVVHFAYVNICLFSLFGKGAVKEKLFTPNQRKIHSFSLNSLPDCSLFQFRKRMSK